MFTITQITDILSKVRTGADFPIVAGKLKNLGVTYYETRIEDGSSVFHGTNGYEVFAKANHGSLRIADQVNPGQLKTDVQNHQNGKSDYFQISRQCADNGIEKWAVCLYTMTCTYIDKAGNRVLVEQIPQ